MAVSGSIDALNYMEIFLYKSLYLKSPESSSATTESRTTQTARVWFGILPVEWEMLD